MQLPGTLSAERGDRLRRYGDRAVNILVGRLEIAHGHITGSKVNENTCILGIERGRSFQIRR